MQEKRFHSSCPDKVVVVVVPEHRHAAPMAPTGKDSGRCAVTTVGREGDLMALAPLPPKARQDPAAYSSKKYWVFDIPLLQSMDYP